MKYETKQLLCRGLFAGLMIAIGCMVYLACENKLVGALLFSAGLFFILSNNGALLTGMCGLPTPWLTLAAVLAFNAAGALLGGILSWPAQRLAEPAAALVANKLAASPLSWLTNGILCGVLMYLAVMGFKRAAEGVLSLASVMYAIPVFIVAGFEHSIADLGYLAIAIPALSWTQVAGMLGMILVVVAGNVIVSKLIRICLEDAQRQKP